MDSEIFVWACPECGRQTEERCYHSSPDNDYSPPIRPRQMLIEEAMSLIAETISEIKRQFENELESYEDQLTSYQKMLRQPETSAENLEVAQSEHPTEDDVGRINKLLH